MSWKPLLIGTCTAEKGCQIRALDGGLLPIDPFKMANAFAESGGDPQTFLSKLLKQEASWQLQQKIG